ncbi:MAG TPA: ABC transporter permease [Bryobacteraceae bacterium]|jgi:predicted permease
MGALTANLRYALRMMRRSPGFTAVAVAALALGIGANTAIFTVVNAVLFEPLPYPQPDRLVRLGRLYPRGHGWSNSIPKFMAWRNNHVFQWMALFDQGGLGLNLGYGDRPEQVRGAHASKDYFNVFGIQPLIGRTFTSAEDAPGGPRVAIISYGLWQSRFAGDRQIIGRAIPFNGEPYTVIGIMPPGFHSETQEDVWIPLQADPNSTNQGHYLAAAARLKPGVTLAAAQAEMKVVGEQFRRVNPKWMDKNESVAVVPLKDALVEDATTPLYILLGTVLLVLLIACANVANLLLARASGRQREMAIRAAVGANRGIVFRQLLTESIVLAGCGGAFGFVLGSWGVRALLLVVPGNIPRLTNAEGQAIIPPLDWRVAAFTIGLALVTGLVFGLFPALRISNPDLVSNLKEGGRAGAGVRHARARSVLVVGEVALALVLLIGAALLIRTFIDLRTVNPGFDAHNVLTMQTSMAGGSYSTTAKVANFETQVLRRIEALPGVENATSTISLPANQCCDLPFTIAGKPPAKGDQYNGDEEYRPISPHYFRVFRIPLLRGREFTETDEPNSARVVIINEALARKYWQKEDPLGHVVTIGKGLGPDFDDPPRQIVGIVANAREKRLSEADPPVLYVPESQMPEGLTKLANSVIPLSWAVRGKNDPLALAGAIEGEFRAVDGLMAVARVRPMEQVVAQTIARDRFTMLLLSIFAGIALLLAAIGIYGLISYSVEQRTQEIGVRMALGAGRANVLGLIFGQGMKLAAVGVALGLAFAFALTRVLSSLLFGVKALDPLTFAAVALLLLVIALAATWFPARRAAVIEPVEALRYQ